MDDQMWRGVSSDRAIVAQRAISKTMRALARRRASKVA
jgi:hypothetical protein